MGVLLGLAVWVGTYDYQALCLTAILLGFGQLIKIKFQYPSQCFPRMSITALLKRVKVSSVRGIPIKIKGQVIGTGVPGLIWSEDFIVRDETGMIFLDYRQPLALWEFFFGLIRGKKYNNIQIEAYGWYRRTPTPYIEISEITSPKNLATKCWVYPVKKATAWLFIFAGIGSFVYLNLQLP